MALQLVFRSYPKIGARSPFVNGNFTIVSCPLTLAHCGYLITYFVLEMFYQLHHGAPEKGSLAITDPTVAYVYFCARSEQKGKLIVIK